MHEGELPPATMAAASAPCSARQLQEELGRQLSQLRDCLLGDLRAEVSRTRELVREELEKAVVPDQEQRQESYSWSKDVTLRGKGKQRSKLWSSENSNMRGSTGRVASGGLRLNQSNSKSFESLGSSQEDVDYPEAGQGIADVERGAGEEGQNDMSSPREEGAPVEQHLPLELPASEDVPFHPSEGHVKILSNASYEEVEPSAEPEVADDGTSSISGESMGFFSRHRRGYMAGKELYRSASGGPGLGSSSVNSVVRRSMDMRNGRISTLSLEAIGWSEDEGEEWEQKEFGAFMMFLFQVQRIVFNPWFDTVSGLVILSNSILLGVQADRMARALDAGESRELVDEDFQVAEFVFCAVFTVELLLRILAYNSSFFSATEWNWNAFDAMVVILQWTEIIVEEVERSSTHLEYNIALVRVMRTLRMVRVLRILRALRSTSELRTIIVSIFGTLRTLMWTLVLLFLVIYVCAIGMTHIVSNHLSTEASTEAVDFDERERLLQHWGSLSRAMLVLFQAISNGVDWENMLNPLTNYISPWLAIPVCAYIGFGIFALMNIVTGVFVESALESAKREQERFLLHTVRNLFNTTDRDKSGEISWDEFKTRLDHPDMHVYFKSIDLDIDEAEDLFKLIDINDSGSIDPEEFVNGCIRLQGPAKAIDLATLMHEYQHGQKREAVRHRKQMRFLGNMKLGAGPKSTPTHWTRYDPGGGQLTSIAEVECEGFQAPADEHCLMPQRPQAGAMSTRRGRAATG